MKKYLLITFSLSLPLFAVAQHHHIDTVKKATTAGAAIKHNKADTATHHHDMDMIDMDMGQNTGGMHGMMMTSQYSKNIPMSRDGSGTSWQPDESPMYAYMIHGKKWMTMIHGNVFARYNNQDIFNKGTRGGSKFDAPNMLMGMTQRKIGRHGLFSFNGMLSLDPFTVGENGYPLLYQTGETYRGRKLVDRQHPHDLFAQLNIAYTQELSKNSDLYLSFGYPSEPALGPPVFMHRLSYINNPDAPLGHHYVDATHISFGVATLGYRLGNAKAEGSAFKGREPDEHRYGFDAMKFDSYAVRLSYNPSRQWALQVSNGWLHSPEEAEPDENVDRFTASAIHTKMLGNDSYVSTTAVYGQNHFDGKTLPSVVLENTLQLKNMAYYGKYEYVVKDSHELDFESIPYLAHRNFNINTLTLGANRILTTVKNTELRLGLQADLNFSPTVLRPLYGTLPVGFEVYLKINPAMLKM